jgi:hypothetical protein
MNVRTPILLIAAVWTLGAAPSARAQALSPERVQIALDATDRRIEQADAIASTSPEPGAQAEVAGAHETQSRARTAFAASRLKMSWQLTFDARAHADRAIALVKGLPDPDRVLVQLERTRDILDRVRSRVEGCTEPRAHGMVAVATTMQEHAESAQAAGRYLGAIELTMGARERAFRALRLCNLEDDLGASVEQALRRTDDVIAKAHDAVAAAPDARARESLAEAIDLEGKAIAEFRATHYDPSLRLTQTARALAHRATRLSRGG